MNPNTAKTSTDQVSALHKYIVKEYNGDGELSIFDYGAGKFGKVDDFAFENNIEYFPYDPFHRYDEINIESYNELELGNIDKVVCSNVINIIDDEDMDDFIYNLVEASRLSRDKELWLSAYYLPKKGQNRKMDGYVQRNVPIQWYMYLFVKYGTIEKVNGFLKFTPDN